MNTALDALVKRVDSVDGHHHNDVDSRVEELASVIDELTYLATTKYAALEDMVNAVTTACADMGKPNVKPVEVFQVEIHSKLHDVVH